MIRVKFTGGTNYCGTDEEAIFEFEDGTSEDIIRDEAADWAIDNAGVWSDIEILEEGDEEE